MTSSNNNILHSNYGQLTKQRHQHTTISATPVLQDKWCNKFAIR